MSRSLPPHPLSGSITGEYWCSDDGTVKVPAIVKSPEKYSLVKSDILNYKWNPEDFLLMSYPKTGTHFTWEVMTMLLKGSPEYSSQPKEALMMDMYALSESNKYFPSPRVLNTHYRPDVLPAEFRKAKTVIVLRNPKDACVSWHFHEVNISATIDPGRRGCLASLTLSDSIHRFLHDNDVPYGTYFNFTECMWSLKDEPNVCLIFYEDLKLNPIENIQKLNEFMGTKRSPELIQSIAEATDFSRMREAKVNTKPTGDTLKLMVEQKRNPERASMVASNMYRKGRIGDWRNHVTVADNEIFDAFLADWAGGKDIPFKY